MTRRREASGSHIAAYVVKSLLLSRVRPVRIQTSLRNGFRSIRSIPLKNADRDASSQAHDAVCAAAERNQAEQNYTHKCLYG